ncbi:ribonuclease III [Acholeplasma sp. OttesenSCG-928-E16]|nr:ribonuclease III [Acholeplasma sp. OttesenSCG-928-E16]
MENLFIKIGITPKNSQLYKLALTHSSYGYENNVDNNEKLEFLGDAVIELMMSDYLFSLDLSSEGEMTKVRAKSVREKALVTYASKIKLADYLLLGKGEGQKGPNDAIIADAFEALFGAIYQDQGFLVCKQVFNKLCIPYLDEVWEKDFDYKTLLQEYMQVDKRTLEYKIVRESGPSHDKEFEARVYVDGILYGKGIGKKKQTAEQNAAKEALSKKAE